MNGEIITIYCCNYSHFLFTAGYAACETFLKNYGYKVEFSQNLDPAIDLTIHGRNVKIIMSAEKMKHCDVCIVGWLTDWTDYIAEVKHQASRCKQQYPEAPIIVVGDAKLKNHPPRLKDLELAGKKVFNRKMGDEFVWDIGAVKYVKYSSKTGSGYKILIDEIVFAYCSKLKDEEDRERMKKGADEVHRERTKRNVFMLEKLLDVLHYF